MTPHTGPAVTVLMAAYNARDFITEAVESVLAQSLADFELLIVDDASTDDTVELAEAFGDPRIRILALPENRGAAAARNEGLRAARAPLIAVLDADDLAYPMRLERQVAYMEAHPRCGMLGTAYHLIDTDGTVQGVVPAPGATPLTRWTLLTRNPYAHCSVMVRREAALATGGYDETLRNAEDYDLWVKLAPWSEPAGLPQVLAAYRDNPRGLTATKPTMDVPGNVRVVQRALSAATAGPVSLDAVRCLKGGQIGGSARAACIEAADALATALERQLARDTASRDFQAALLDQWRAQTERLPERAPAAVPAIVVRSWRLLSHVGASPRAFVSRGHVIWAVCTIGRAVRASWRRAPHTGRRLMGHDRRAYIEDRALQSQEALLLRIFAQSERLTILDAGTCEGENAIRYARLFPRATVYAVEPLPRNYQLLLENLREYGTVNVTPVEGCLAGEDGEAELHVSSGSPPQSRESHLDWSFGNKSSSLLAPGRSAHIHPWLEFTETVNVKTMRLDSLAAQNDIQAIDFFHLDVQGAELMVLCGAGALLPRIRTLWLEVEVVPLYHGQPVRVNLEGFLREHGFVKLVDAVGDVAGDQFWAQSAWLARRKGRPWVLLERLRQSLCGRRARRVVRGAMRRVR